MSTLPEDRDRNIIPRWRDSNISASNPEHLPLREIPAKEINSYELMSPNVDDWQKNRTLSFATDLVSSAFALGVPETAKEAAQFVLEKGSGASELAKRIAEYVLERPEGLEKSELPKRPGSDDLRAEIRLRRKILHSDPRNPLVWLDLARTYTTLGVKAKAEQALNLALKLAPENRYVLRSAARFFIHKEDPQRAHQILLDASPTKEDPWLLAAEIAVSRIIKRSSKLVKNAKVMLDSDQFHPSHLSELSSALATLELANGNDKKSRRLFRQSLISPTENSVAQFRWASQRIGSLPLEQRYLETPFSFEAKAWEYLKASDLLSSLNETWHWFFDQPFSVRPVLLGSFLASTMLEDFSQAEKILRLGLVSNKNDPVVLNNLAFVLASQGDEKGASQFLTRIDLSTLSEENKVVITATQGLLEFRKGEIDHGRKLYLDAIANAKDPWGKQYRIRASAYLLREEMHAKTAFVEMALARFLSEASGSEDSTTEVLKKRLVERYRNLSKAT